MFTPWKTISSKSVLSTPWFEIMHNKVQPDEAVETLYDYYTFERSDVVIVFGMTPDEKVILLREYKYGANTTIVTLPAGLVENSDDEMEAAARREFEEETGYSPGSMEFVSSWFTDPTGSNSRIHFFIARDCEKRDGQALDETERIEPFLVEKSQVMSLIKEGKIANNSALSALCHLFMNDIL